VDRNAFDRLVSPDLAVGSCRHGRLPDEAADGTQRERAETQEKVTSIMLARQKREGDVVLKLIGHESRTYCYLIVYPEPFFGRSGTL
jgi:hypothetical protein